MLKGKPVFVSWAALLLVAANWCGSALAAEKMECGDRPPNPAPPHNRGSKRVSASESTYCPLPPLPITPQRRTESKKPPSPPALMVRLKHGPRLKKPWSKGYMEDWNRKPEAVHNLLKWFGKEVESAYDYADLGVEEFSFDPDEVPVVYMIGHREVDFPASAVGKMRGYVQKGGFLLCESCCGDPDRMKWYRSLTKRMFPDQELHRLAPDHPLFRAGYELTQAQYLTKGEKSTGPPVMWGVDLGCRTAVLVSEMDMSGGWARARYSYSYGRRYCEADAVKMGANIARYAMATAEMGRKYGASFVLTDQKRPTGNEFRIAHLEHPGQWNTNPSALSMLLSEIRKTTSLEVKFGECSIPIRDLSAKRYPFAYLTGHHGFELKPNERTALRQYFASGGFLLADSCCGRVSFDECFRKLIKDVAGAELKPLPPDHPVFTSLHKIGQVMFTAPETGKGPAQLEAVHLDKRVAVVYSKYGLGCGWQHKSCAFCRGYSSADSLRLGANIVMYSMLH